MQCDIAVVGAGLAGLQCARLLAQRGLDVVLIDRSASVATPTYTTGIFVRKTWEDFPIPDEQLGRGIRDVYLYSPRLRALHLTAERDEFRVGRISWIRLYMLDQCTRAGVRWLPSTDVRDCREVRGGMALSLARRGELTARYVVAADGPRSRLARSLGLDRNTEFLVGLEEIVPLAHAETALHCYLDPQLAPGYIAWIVADGAEAHIGVAGYRGAFDPARALARFRHKTGYDDAKVLERRGGLLPVNGVLRRIANHHGLLVGDAAGAVSPLTAGGLDGAMRLSTHAADVIEAYLQHGDRAVLRSYDGARLQTRFAVRRWMRKAMRATQHPALMEAGVALLHVPPLRAFAAHVFFNRGGSFPELRYESAIAAAQ